MQDIEFTVQEGRFYMLQTRSGKRTGRAAVRIAVEMVAEGMIERAGSAAAGSPEHVQSFLHPMVDPAAEREVVATGLPASPGGVTGIAVFSADEAVEQEATGQRVILLRRETTPEDIHGMKVAEGVLTELGGMTSHAAVVARGMGVCAITGCDALRIDTAAGTATAEDGTVIRRGDVVTLDGATGEVMLGDVPKIEASSSGDFQTLLGWADKYRRLKVRANAETPEDAAKARELGAEGIGLCRTEHMFFGRRAHRPHARHDPRRQRRGARQGAGDSGAVPEQRHAGAVRAMDGLPVTIRLLDPPLHEFLPHERRGYRHARRAPRTGRGHDTAYPQRPDGGQPDARLPRLPPVRGVPGNHRHAGARDHRCGAGGTGRGPAPAAGNHDSAGRQRARDSLIGEVIDREIAPSWRRKASPCATRSAP
jgi:pyruvate,orthophosphate dikinase